MSYSQYPHQERYLRLLTRLYPPRRRVFVDVGAFDGLHLSNVRHLYEAGWSGVCVEAASVNYERLERLYAGTEVATVNRAVGSTDGSVTLHVAEIPGNETWGSDTSTIRPEEMAKWPEYRWRTEEVPMSSLDRILYDLGVTGVDLVSIDVEGGELEVLRGFDIARAAPRVMIVEYNEPQRRRLIAAELRGQGMHVVIDNGTDLFVVGGDRRRALLLRVLLTPVEAVRRLMAAVRARV